MNPLQRMEAHREAFTQNDRMIYETILQNPAAIVHMTTSTLAERCGVSQPALSRFVKTLGYGRYQEFRADLIAWMTLKDNLNQQQGMHLGYFATLYQVLAEAEKLLTDAYMRDLTQYINGFDRVFASGTNKSFQPAQLLETLMRRHRRQFQACARDYLIELADYMDENDLLIVFSVSGGGHILEDACRTSGKILLVTATAGYACADRVDRAVILPYVTTDPETSSVSPVLFSVFVELLVSYLSQPRKIPDP